jgi:hypothetical protein
MPHRDHGRYVSLHRYPQNVLYYKSTERERLMEEKVPYIKHYESKEYLEACIAAKMTSKDIANQNRVSYKLVNAWLIEHGLLRNTPEIRLP